MGVKCKVSRFTSALVAHTIIKLNFFGVVGVLQIRPEGMWEGQI